MKIRIACFILLVFFFSACYYDKEELVYPPDNSGNNCNTTNVSYANEITPILSLHCYGCHGGNAADGAGIKLDTYTTLKVQVNNGKLIKVINHAPGVPAMPQNGAKLNACKIQTIESWVNAGALQN